MILKVGHVAPQGTTPRF